MSNKNRKLDGYFRKSKQWQEVLEALRTIVLDSPLTEEVKWRQPCYTFQDRNIVILGRFKEYCALTFVKGALLKDPCKILARPGENTQAARVIRFTTVEHILELEPDLKAFVQQAIDVEKAGLKVKLKKISDFKLPEELENKFDERPELKTAFRALTPGRQRAYLLHFSGAKQAKTREARVEKCVERILEGKGMDDD